MTERGLPSADASPACPFVAFDDDRDSRADRPDHRHRCFAESEPAPRALAHQEAYCLSSAFPVCPTFQAWARREAAQARSDAAAANGRAATSGTGAGPEDAAGGGAATAGGAAAGAGAAASAGGARPAPADEWTAPPGEPDVPLEATPRRNPPRDWAAPPPWATGGGAAGAYGTTTSSPSGGTGAGGAEARPSTGPRPPTEGQGLAGSAADRLASGGSVTGPAPGPATDADLPSSPPDPELAGLVAGGRAVRDEGPATPPPSYPPPTRSGRRPSVSSTRSSGRPPAREPVQSHEGPSWESARRYEAYPQIKSRSGLGGLPSLPRVAVLAGALGIAALALFFLPALFGVGGDDSPSPSPTVTVAPATPSPDPTPEPEPTPQTYTIKEGDTLSKIAREFGITLQELLDANTDTITDPDRISVGDVIIIPVPIPEEVEGGGSSEEPAP